MLTNHPRPAIDSRLVANVISWQLLTSILCLSACPAAEPDVLRILDSDQLVAWCIVPFDSTNRTPAQRAKMVRDLGLRRVAYDWREKHVPEFEEEILQYKKHGLEFFAFWSWHDSMELLIRKHDIHPQIWVMMPQPDSDTQEERVRQAAAALLPMVQKTASLNCRLGIYNHGGWSGEPANMVVVCEHLKRHHQAAHVGIVYNFHHGHEHIEHFATHFGLMMPHLICLNLNGMADVEDVRAGQRKILAPGQGVYERSMIQQVLKSGYTGPIGVLDHQPDRDTAEVLRENLRGIRTLRESLTQ